MVHHRAPDAVPDSLIYNTLSIDDEGHNADLTFRSQQDKEGKTLSWDEWYDVVGAIAEFVNQWAACRFSYEVVEGDVGFVGWGWLGVYR